jgi:two-component system CheB/CheR fusion protein
MVEHVHKLLLEEIGPGFVIVGPNRELLYSGGRIGQYLEMPLGTPSLELINVVSPDLKMDVRALWHRVTTDQRGAGRENIVMSAREGQPNRPTRKCPVISCIVTAPCHRRTIRFCIVSSR